MSNLLPPLPALDENAGEVDSGVIGAGHRELERKAFYGLLVILAVLAVLLILFSTALKAAAGVPNIVYILADDLGYGDVNYSYPPTPNVTPNIDKLAAEGVKLTSFYAEPICTPSRASLMTSTTARATRGATRGVLMGRA